MKKSKNTKNELFGIIGLGLFGQALAETLAQSGKELIIVDRNQEKINAAASLTDNAYAIGTFTRESLEKIGLQDCDVVIVCIGEEISISILTTLTVIRMGVPRVIAKAKNEDHGSVLKLLGAEVIYPEHDMGVRLAKRLTSSRFFDYLSLSDNVDITEILLTQKADGMTVAEMNSRKRFGLNIIAIKHDDEIATEIGPQTVLHDGDIITVVGKRQNIYQMEAYLSD